MSQTSHDFWWERVDKTSAGLQVSVAWKRIVIKTPSHPPPLPLPLSRIRNTAHDVDGLANFHYLLCTMRELAIKNAK